MHARSERDLGHSLVHAVISDRLIRNFVRYDEWVIARYMACQILELVEGEVFSGANGNDDILLRWVRTTHSVRRIFWKPR